MSQTTWKRRRRRRQARPAVAAHLLIDASLTGETGILSEDLLRSFFPELDTSEGASAVRHVAIAPRAPAPQSDPLAISWTILAVRKSNGGQHERDLPHSSLAFPEASPALQHFLALLPKAGPRRDGPIDIRILDTVPAGLDTVYININAEALRKLHDAHTKLGGGFSTAPRGSKGAKSKIKTKVEEPDQMLASAEMEKTWRIAVRQALATLDVVHTGRTVSLPLPSHPITHASPPPIKIVSCDPVSQGVMRPTTRIVAIHSAKYGNSASKTKEPAVSFLNRDAEDDEDTSNEQFFSAAEDRSRSQTESPPSERDVEFASDQLTSDLSEIESDLSDDPDDLISLDAPLLSSQASGSISAFNVATPRVGLAHTNGIATPGSAISGFTATTVRANSAKGKVLQPVGLKSRIPEALLHPQPTAEDDEESRIYVETHILAKVGCFSGDWVRLEAATEPTPLGLGSWGMGSRLDGEPEEVDTEWRAVKIYGLPAGVSQRPQRLYPTKPKPHQRFTSITALTQPVQSSQVYLSPVMLYNLKHPSHVRVSFLPQHQIGANVKTGAKGRASGAIMPPIATEVAVSKIHTPLAMEKRLQNSLFAALKGYFASKRRVIKNGDYLAIAFDESLARALSADAGQDEDAGAGELVWNMSRTGREDFTTTASQKLKSVAWFRVTDSKFSPQSEEDGEEEQDNWGGATYVDPASTTMKISTSERAPLPPATNNPWQYYLGARRSPFASPIHQPVSDNPQPYTSTLRRRLRELMAAATSRRAIELGLPPLAVLISSNQRLIGKSTTVNKACGDLGYHTFSIDAFEVLAGNDMASRSDIKTTMLKTRADKGLGCGAEYTALLIKHIEALEADKMITILKETIAKSRVLIATTTDLENISEGVRSLFSHELEMSAPDEGEREGILRGIVDDLGAVLAPDVTLASIAVKTAALVAGDLVDVIERALIAKRIRLEAVANRATEPSSDSAFPVTVHDLQLAGGPSVQCLTSEDLNSAVEAARSNFADSIGAPKIPNVSWSDVGGLANVKSSVMETIQLPLARPELFAKGMKKRSGILFYGPPGTGKTLLAKAIATEFSLNFFSVKGPELLNMYIGESEANVRRVFQRARDARPCVVFFDELDSVAPKRGNQGDSGGVMDRIVSQLLAELDGMSDGSGSGSGSGVFVIGATNRPDLLDQALLRPGRFDKMLYLGISDTNEKQQRILEALTRKFALHPDLSLARIAGTLPFTYTGADLYALCSDAMLKAITRQSASVDAKVKAYNDVQTRKEDHITIAQFFDHHATPEDLDVLVTERDFLDAKAELVPSVSLQELQHYDRVRQAFEGADDKGQVEESSSSSASGSQLQGKGKAPMTLARNAQAPVVANGKHVGEDRRDDVAMRPNALRANGTKLSIKQKLKQKLQQQQQQQQFGHGAENDDSMYE